MKFEKEFREAHPETVGEIDKEFDNNNYIEWLEGKNKQLEMENKNANRWNALLNSNRIRFLGSARLGKKRGQVLCLEFHSDGEDSEKEHYNTEFAKERLLKYTDTLIGVE